MTSNQTRRQFWQLLLPSVEFFVFSQANNVQSGWHARKMTQPKPCLQHCLGNGGSAADVSANISVESCWHFVWARMTVKNRFRKGAQAENLTVQKWVEFELSEIDLWAQCSMENFAALKSTRSAKCQRLFEQGEGGEKSHLHKRHREN